MPSRKPAYKIVKRDGLCYVFGYIGAGKYMQMSDGMSEKAAISTVRRFAMAQASATAELRSWDGKRGRD